MFKFCRMFVKSIIQLLTSQVQLIEQLFSFIELYYIDNERAFLVVRKLAEKEFLTFFKRIPIPASRLAI